MLPSLALWHSCPRTANLFSANTQSCKRTNVYYPLGNGLGVRNRAACCWYPTHWLHAKWCQQLLSCYSLIAHIPLGNTPCQMCVWWGQCYERSIDWENTFRKQLNLALCLTQVFSLWKAPLGLGTMLLSPADCRRFLQLGPPLLNNSIQWLQTC